MTNIDIVMTPDETKATIRNAYIRRVNTSSYKYVIYLDLPFHFSDTKELERVSKWLDVKRSNSTKRFYIIGYLGPQYHTYYNGLYLDSGDEYFVPVLEIEMKNKVDGHYSFHILSDDVHCIHRVGPAYNAAHAENSNKNKEETKMATAYDAKGSGFGIKKVIFNPPATIVFWNDSGKTVVKCSEDDIFDPLAGIAFALMRKVYGKEYRKIEKFAKEYKKLHFPVDISAMALDSLLDDLAETAMAGYVCSDKEYEAVVSGEKEVSDNGAHE